MDLYFQFGCLTSPYALNLFGFPSDMIAATPLMINQEGPSIDISLGQVTRSWIVEGNFKDMFRVFMFKEEGGG